MQPMAYRSRGGQTWRRLRPGALSLPMTMLVVLLTVVLLPFLWNLGAIYTVRGAARTGSDAAALAAAEELARRLNAASGDWWGCLPPETDTLIVRRYVNDVVLPLAAAQQRGQAVARNYAAAHNQTLTGYGQRIRAMAADGIHARAVAGVVIAPVIVDVASAAAVRGMVGLPGGELSGRPITAHASAEVYLAQVRRWETPCPAQAQPEAVAVHYAFRWRIRLVPADW